MKEKCKYCGWLLSHCPDDIHWHYICPKCDAEFDLDMTDWERKG